MVGRDSLSRIMPKYGCHKKFTIVRQFHDGMHARVQDNWENSIVFHITNGVKQRGVLARTLLSIVFFAMLFDAFSGSDIGINIQYRTDGSAFKLRSLQAKIKVKTVKFLFTDDCALPKPTCKTVWQVLSGLWQLWPNHQHKKRRQKWCTSQQLKVVEKFTYLSTLSIVMDDEVNTRLTKASAAFGWLNRNVWNLRGNQNQGIPSCCSYHPVLWL